MQSNTPVGKTKDAGWEIGVRRTLPVSAEAAWEALVTPPGLELWLGKDDALEWKKGATYRTEDGTTGDLRSYTEGELIRLTWQPPDWDEASTLQVRVIPAKEKATISFHHERLADAAQREAMRGRWAGVLDQLEALLVRSE